MNSLSKQTITLIEARIAAGETYTDIGRAVGISPSTVREIALGNHFHQQPAGEQERRRNAMLRNYLPTPEEIAAQCERFIAENPRLPVGYTPFEWFGPLFPG